MGIYYKKVIMMFSHPTMAPTVQPAFANNMNPGFAPIAPANAFGG